VYNISTKMELIFTCKPFSSLTNIELYDILHLRSKVFVVEQNCIFLDMDGKDNKCLHVLGYYNNELVAYTRLVEKNISYTEASIGRVVTALHVRKWGFGKALMEYSIQELYNQFGKQAIKIGAQLYLQKFYESFGFVVCGNIYLEDGIDHVEMILT
jgi:ElaA protein